MAPKIPNVPHCSPEGFDTPPAFRLLPVRDSPFESSARGGKIRSACLFQIGPPKNIDNPRVFPPKGLLP